MMTKRRFAWFASALVALGALALGTFGLSGTHTVRVEEAVLQSAIDAQLPKTHKGVTIEKAVVSLVGTDAHITIHATGDALGQHFSLVASGEGAPEYRPSTESFYVHPKKFAVTKLELSGGSVVDNAGKFLERYVTDPRLKERVAGSLPGVKLWVEDNVVPRAIERIGEMPLYKPKNDLKGTIIKATLSSIAVDNNAVVLTFSLLQLTISVFVALAALVMSLLIVLGLMRNPEWGIPIIALSAIG